VRQDTRTLELRPLQSTEAISAPPASSVVISPAPFARTRPVNIVRDSNFVQVQDGSGLLILKKTRDAYLSHQPMIAVDASALRSVSGQGKGADAWGGPSANAVSETKSVFSLRQMQCAEKSSTGAAIRTNRFLSKNLIYYLYPIVL